MSSPRMKSQRKIKKILRNYENPIVNDEGTRKNNKKVKLNESLNYCEKIIKELFSGKHNRYAWPFYKPVDAEFLGLTDYHTIIKNPMDLGTIRTKLNDGMYKTSKAFISDMQLMFDNCYTYNPPHHPVVESAKCLQKVFESRIVNLPKDQSEESIVSNDAFDQIYTETIKYRDSVLNTINSNITFDASTMKVSHLKKERIGIVQGMLKEMKVHLQTFVDGIDKKESNHMPDHYASYTVASNSSNTSGSRDEKFKKQSKLKLSRKQNRQDLSPNYDKLDREKNVYGTVLRTPLTKTSESNRIKNKKSQEKSSTKKLKIENKEENSRETNPRVKEMVTQQKIDDVTRKQKNMTKILKKKNLIFMKKLKDENPLESIEILPVANNVIDNAKVNKLPSGTNTNINKKKEPCIVEQNVHCSKEILENKKYKKKKLTQQNLSKILTPKKRVLNENNNIVVQCKTVPLKLKHPISSYSNSIKIFQNEENEIIDKEIALGDDFISSSKLIKTSEIVVENHRMNIESFETVMSSPSKVQIQKSVILGPILPTSSKTPPGKYDENNRNLMFKDTGPFAISKIPSDTMLSEFHNSSVPDVLSTNSPALNNMLGVDFSPIANQISKDLISISHPTENFKLNDNLESKVPTMDLIKETCNTSVIIPMEENSEDVFENTENDLIDRTINTTSNVSSLLIQSSVPFQNIDIPMDQYEEATHDSMAEIATKSWSSQESNLSTPSILPLKSSVTDSLFLAFKKQALEKALKEKQFFEQRKLKKESLMRKQNKISYEIKKKKKEIEDLERIKPTTIELIEEEIVVNDNVQFGCHVDQHERAKTIELDLRMSERDQLKLEEQERRRRIARAANIDLLMQSNVMADFEQIL